MSFRLCYLERISHPDITEIMLRLHNDCPTLFQTILPRSERSSNRDESDISILPDQEHSQTPALLCIYQYYVKDFLKLPIRLARWTMWIHSSMLSETPTLRTTKYPILSHWATCDCSGARSSCLPRRKSSLLFVFAYPSYSDFCSSNSIY